MPPTTNALSADSLLSYISQSLPAREDQQALKDPYAAISILAHACMLAVGFRLVGLGEDHKIDARVESPETQPLPAEWDQQSGYAFRYTHPQSSMQYVLKITRLGGKAMVQGLGLGDDKIAQFDVKAEDYTSAHSLKDAKRDNVASLKHALISPGRIDDLASLVKARIIQKLIPGLRKDGYEETPAETSAAAEREPARDQPRDEPRRDARGEDAPAPARPHPFDDPLALPPRRPGPVPDFAPPGFEDEHELLRPRRGFPGAAQPFGNIGERDLYPPGLGPHDPLRIGPGGGGGGMHPTFDDPLFRGQGRPPGYDPRTPPGARYDPVGPGDGPPQLRGGPRGPGGGGRPPNPFGGFGDGDFI